MDECLNGFGKEVKQYFETLQSMCGYKHAYSLNRQIRLYSTRLLYNGGITKKFSISEVQNSREIDMRSYLGGQKRILENRIPKIWKNRCSPDEEGIEHVPGKRKSPTS